MVWLVPVDGVLGQGALPPCVDAAYTMDVEVDVQVDKLATLNFVGMVCAFKVLLAIIPCSDAERLAAFNTKSRERRAGSGEFEPSDICAASVVLGITADNLSLPPSPIYNNPTPSDLHIPTWYYVC